MNSIVGVMQKVAQQEAARIYTTELGIVTAVFPHATEKDKDNYQCSVKLKNKKQPNGKDFELRQVPMMTPHIGLVNVPNVGDLVLINFIGGDINAPVMMGRLYTDQDRPPMNKPKEFLLQHPAEKGSAFQIDDKGIITVTHKEKKNTVTVDDKKIVIANEKCQTTFEGDKVTTENETCHLALEADHATLDNGKCSVDLKGDAATVKNQQCSVALAGGKATVKNQRCKVELSGGSVTIDSGLCKIKVDSGGITIDAATSGVTVKSMGSIKIGDATTAAVQVGGRLPANAVGDNDTIMLTSHTHVGNLGAPCPVMVPIERINSVQAKIRNTKVG